MESESTKLLSSEAITLGIAIWGAVLATITFGWNLLRDLSNRGRLRVTCYIGAIVIPGVGIQKKDVLVWSVVNVGRQPIMLTNIGGQLDNNTGFVVNTQQPLPRMLQPGEYFMDYMDDNEKVEEKRLKNLSALTSVGKTYTAPKKEVEKIKKQLAELKAKQNPQSGENPEDK